MKIGPVGGGELFHNDGQQTVKQMTNLSVVFAILRTRLKWEICLFPRHEDV